MRNRARARAATSVVLAAVVAALATGSAYAAPSVSVQAPPTVKANTEFNVVYAGQAEPAPGATGMLLQLFYEPNATGCAATPTAQGERAGSKPEGQQYIAATGPTPFNFTSPMFFPAVGSYRICAYLGVFPADATVAPAAIADAAVQVGLGTTPCVVPKLKGLSVATATARLKAAGCRLGRVSKPSRAGKRKLVITAQSPGANLTVEAGTKVTIFTKFKRR